MSKVDIKKSDGAKSGTIELDENIFGIEPNVAVMHQVVNAQLAAKKRTSSDGGDSTPIRNDAYVGFGLGQREQEVFQRCPGDSADQINGLIRATYRQVMGNPHLMESERAMAAESRYAEGYLSTRELVRAIALSPEYSRRFFETNAPYRFVELNFKHFLGRAPKSQAELSEHIQILANDGYEAEINSYLDSAEYQNTFGEDTVPYMRILTEEGRAQVAFNRHLSLAEGFAASDAVLNSASLVTSMATNSVPSCWRTTTSRTNRNGAVAGSPSATTKRFRIVVQAQPRGGRQRERGGQPARRGEGSAALPAGMRERVRRLGAASRSYRG